jgi:hypothetical protein
MYLHLAFNLYIYKLFALVQRHLKLIKGFDEICYLFINDRFLG